VAKKRQTSKQVDFRSPLQAEIAKKVLAQFGIPSNVSRDGVVEAYFNEETKPRKRAKR
jgi:hypothetical protein